MYFRLASDALCDTVKERGVLASKKVRRISRACLREQFRLEEMIVMSRLSANQADSEAASPAARYLAIEEKTENSPSGDWRTPPALTSVMPCPNAESERKRANAAERIWIRFFIPFPCLAKSAPNHYFCEVNITLLTVGKTDVKWVREGLELYASRLKHYVPFSVTEIPELKKVSALTERQIREKEGELILKLTGPQDRLVLLDEQGRTFRSAEFAVWLEKTMSGGAKNLVFAVGGAYGFSEAVYARAQEKISLSAMTFPHQLVRTIFAEQLYRAFTILRGEPYHHA